MSDKMFNAWFCSLRCYCMTKSPLHVTSVQSTTWDTLNILWCLLIVNTICDLLRMTRRETKWIILDRPSLNLSSIFLLKSHTLNYHPTSVRKRMEVGRFAQQLCLSYHKMGQSVLKRVAPTTFVKFSQYWAICIENIVN